VAAEQPERMRRVGVLSNLSQDDPEARARDAAFVQELRQFDWIDGHNVQIECRWAAADSERFRTFATELAALAPDVILAYTSPAVAALQQVTNTIPIVFISVIYPVGAGVVETLAQAGGNATGFTVFEYGISGKWLELLKEIAPWVTRAAIIRDPTIPAGIGQFGGIQAVAPSLGMEFSAIGVGDPAVIERAVPGFSPGSRSRATWACPAST
jgi:putative ABC transport system substrate-binding protein